MKELLRKNIEKSMTYQEYVSLISSLIDQGKTTGPNQSESLLNYTVLNSKRMTRLDKTIKFTPESESYFSTLKGEYRWLVISEGWCGDASQILPIINALSSLTSSIDLSIVLRDENPELMDHFEINGTRSIPVVILLDRNSLDVLGVWGARPKPAQVFVDEYKKLTVKPPYEELSIKLQKWYNQDKGTTTQEELTDFMKKSVERRYKKAA